MSTSPETLTLAKLSAALKTPFRVRTGPATQVDFELMEAAPLGTTLGQAAKESSNESFSLVFHGPGDRMLPQGTYGFEHETMGAFVLFIVPIGQAPGVFQYQAVFNRVR